MTKKSVTMRQIAEALGVSVSAVSIAMNNGPGVTEDLRAKVIRVARDMGYDFGRLQKKRSVEVELGFLVNKEYLEKGDPRYARTLSAAQAEAERRGYHLLIGALSPEEAQNGKLPQFFSKTVRGVIIDGGFDERYVLDNLGNQVPVVLFGYDYLDVAVDSVRPDDFAGALIAVNYLLDAGRRNIGLVWALPGNSSNARRRQGYLFALEQAGIRLDPSFMSPGLPVNEPEAGAAAAMELIERHGDVLDAIFCVTDPLATGCLKAVADCGLQVPDDVSVIGFDDQSWVEHLTPPLTTMHVPAARIAQRATRRLIELVEARACGEEEDPIKIDVPVELVVRGSVAPARERKERAVAVAR